MTDSDRDEIQHQLRLAAADEKLRRLDEAIRKQLRDQNGELQAEVADLREKLLKAQQEAYELRTRLSEAEARAEARS